MAGEDQNLAKQQLDWAKQQYTANRGVTDKVTGDLLDTAAQNKQFAGTLKDEYTGNVLPLENKFIQEAQDYASPGMMELQRGRAEAGVAQNFESQRQNAQKNLESYGLNPGSTRYAALDLGVRAQQAAATAAAANQSDLNTKAQGYALENQALQLGASLPGQVAGTYNEAMTADSGAVNANNSTYATGANAMGTSPQYMGLGSQALGLAGSTLNTQYKNQLDQFKTDQASSSGFGQMLGTAAGIGAKFAFAAKGGAIEDPAAAGGEDGGPFDAEKYYVLHAHDDKGRVMAHAEAVKRFFQTGRHVGTFGSEAEARAHLEHGRGRLVGVGHGSDDPQRQSYQKFAIGGQALPAPPVTPNTQGQVPTSASPTGGRAIDDVDARLTPGEFIMPRDVSAWLGEEKLQKMIQKARVDKAKAPARPDVRQALPVG